MKLRVYYFIKKIRSWIFALITTILFLNVLIVPFYHFAPWIDIPCNATTGLFRPGSTIVYGLEGWSVRRVDNNGYVNPKERANNDSYILVMGASHSVGKEIPYGRSYIDILEKEGGYNVYNASMDGNYFVEIMQGFDAAIQQFDKAESVIIEINSINLSDKDIERAKETRAFNSEYTGYNITRSLSKKNKLKMYLQDYFPLIRQIQRNVKANDTLFTNENVITSISEESYYNSVNSILSDRRSKFDGNIVVLYHPSVVLTYEGKLKIVEEPNVKAFSYACSNNNIEFINLGDDFMDMYNDYKIPYGFQNTVIGKGHLNQFGHRTAADRLLDYYKNK